jgi:hypothetical protein
MRNIFRLAFAMLVASTALLAPVAHAQDEGIVVGPFVYSYIDDEGSGTMTVNDDFPVNGGYRISVTVYQNGYTFTGWGYRSYARRSTGYLANIDVVLYGAGNTYRFQGTIPLGGGQGSGNYWLNGRYGPYPWTVYAGD